MVLMMPSPADSSQSAKYHPHTKFLRVFGQSQEWCHILGANNAADVNRMIQEGKLREFIRVNEALHDKSLSYIADEITSRHPAAGERRKARSGIHRRAGRAPFDRKPRSTA